jgi:folate-dependent phosphoribosylglycinamide formyltransferase PurN
MHANIDIQLKSLQLKLQQLLKQYKLLQKENEQLKKEITTLKTNAENNAQLTQTLQQTIDVKSVVLHQKNSNDKVALEKRIDQYLQEIDKCLLLLNAQS